MSSQGMNANRIRKDEISSPLDKELIVSSAGCRQPKLTHLHKRTTAMQPMIKLHRPVAREEAVSEKTEPLKQNNQQNTGNIARVPLKIIEMGTYNANINKSEEFTKPNSVRPKSLRFSVNGESAHSQVDNQFKTDINALHRAPRYKSANLMQHHLPSMRGDWNPNQSHSFPQTLTVLGLAREPITEESGLTNRDFRNRSSPSRRIRAQSCLSNISLADRQYQTPEQKIRANRKERLLTSTAMNSNFSRILREVIKPDHHNPVARTMAPLSRSARQCRAYSADLSAKSAPINPYRSSMPSLRMENEESSFTQYMRLNKSAAQRLTQCNGY